MREGHMAMLHNIKKNSNYFKLNTFWTGSSIFFSLDLFISQEELVVQNIIQVLIHLFFFEEGCLNWGIGQEDWDGRV